MRNITDIYKEYKIMPNLQEHQLRVASVAVKICESLDMEVDKEEIVTACLLHDMGNIIKFNLSYFPEFLGPEGLEYWQSVKEDYIKKYGNDEHKASAEIARGIGVSDRIVDLINSISFTKALLATENEDLGKKIVEYCDDRVTPFGIVGIEERFIDLRNRYAHKQNSIRTEMFENAIREVEKQIFMHSKIKPEDITDESIKIYMEKLKNFKI